jgi:hypothetical protein
MKIQSKNPNFLRDTANRALINNNNGELIALKAKRTKDKAVLNEIADLKNQLEQLKKLILER